MKICDFTKAELNKFREECNFTDTELLFFNYRSTDMSLEEIAEKMDYSVSTINRLSKKVKKKILRVV